MSWRDDGRWADRPMFNFEDLLSKFNTVELNDKSIEEDNEEEIVIPKELLQVSGIDQNISNNVKSHHTDEFDITDANKFDNKEFLVIRRGQQFTMTINFNRPYDPETDDLRILFQFGKSPLPSKGTRAQFVLSDKDDPKEWGAFIKKRDGTSIEVVFMTPASCPVGKWFLIIDVVKREEENTTVYRHSHIPPIYVLFNPWCEDDGVYMKEEELRDEYVLNEKGKIYVGSYRRHYGRPWGFGQFSGDVLDCVIYLLDCKRARFPDYCRGDPVTVVRKLSSMVNSSDNSGVIRGNWSGKYEYGTAPLEWTGSVDILHEFYKSKETVKYGQCWVFSGVLTTVCRALGIPARSITNFDSAHDKDGSTTIDMIFKPDGEVHNGISDSTWNFHVWNETWMARPNLPPVYSGWQAIDATPQEASGGYYQMGPMPVLAVKRGDLNVPYDGPFLFAEVNADRLNWKLNEDGSMTLESVDKHCIGRLQKTKKVGEGTGESITNLYKFPEESEEERAAVKRAGQYASSGKRPDVSHPDEDVEFKIDVPDTALGEPIKVRFDMKNKSNSTRTIDGTMLLTSLFYTGVAYTNLIELPYRNISLKPKQEKGDTLTVEYSDYMVGLKDYCLFKVSSMFTVYETKQVYTNIQDLCLEKPDLIITAPDSAQIGKTFKIEVSFKNPLPVTLSKCELRVDGPGHQQDVIYKQPNVPSKEKFTGTFDMVPAKAGQKEIIVLFNCSQISGVSGTHSIKIKS